MADRRAAFSCALLSVLLLPSFTFGPLRFGSGDDKTTPHVISRAAEGHSDADASGTATPRATASSVSEASSTEATAPGPPAHLLEHNQMVVFYGSPIAAGLGILGAFEVEEAAQRVRDHAGTFDAINGDRGVVPAFDLIYGIAMDEPTENGLFVSYLPDWEVQRYLDMAERYDLQLILDLQIGRANIIDEVRNIERFLVNPRVHVAIDPEYAVGPDGFPIFTPGRISGHQINEVQRYLADLVLRENLPPKLLVIHQYMDETITEGEATEKLGEVDVVLNMDAYGPVIDKLDKYVEYAHRPYAHRDSFNIFLQLDERVLTERELLSLAPQPDVVFYQ